MGNHGAAFDRRAGKIASVIRKKMKILNLFIKKRGNKSSRATTELPNRLVIETRREGLVLRIAGGRVLYRFLPRPGGGVATHPQGTDYLLNDREKREVGMMIEKAKHQLGQR